MISQHPSADRHRIQGPVARWIARVVDFLVQRVPAFLSLRRLLETIVRFAGVGILSSLAYAVAVAILATGCRIGPQASAVCGYCGVIPLNFLMHRHFTFRSASEVGGDLLRYAFAQAGGIAVSYGAMALCVDILHLPYAYGILGAVVSVPVVTYLLLDRWVFGKPLEAG